jgi:predicted CopG family antitoxin
MHTASTTIRIDRDVIVKLDMLGKFQESYSQVIDRLASKQLALQLETRAAEIEKEASGAFGTNGADAKAKTGYHTPLENMSF